MSRPTDTYVVDALATMLGTADEWRSAADYLEAIADLVGQVRPHPGASDGAVYAVCFRQATGRDVVAAFDTRENA